MNLKGKNVAVQRQRPLQKCHAKSKKLCLIRGSQTVRVEHLPICVDDDSFVVR